MDPTHPPWALRKRPYNDQVYLLATSPIIGLITVYLINDPLIRQCNNS